MAVINKLENTASVVYNGSTILSDPVSTVLLLPPVVIKSVDKHRRYPHLHCDGC